jgi:hypothetical protein
MSGETATPNADLFRNIRLHHVNVPVNKGRCQHLANLRPL